MVDGTAVADVQTMEEHESKQVFGRGQSQGYIRASSLNPEVRSAAAIAETGGLSVSAFAGAAAGARSVKWTGAVDTEQPQPPEADPPGMVRTPISQTPPEMDSRRAMGLPPREANLSIASTTALSANNAQVVEVPYKVGASHGLHCMIALGSGPAAVCGTG